MTFSNNVLGLGASFNETLFNELGRFSRAQAEQIILMGVDNVCIFKSFVLGFVKVSEGEIKNMSRSKQRKLYTF